MNFMSVNLPYPTSSLADVLSILETVSEPAKIKKIIKDLHSASVEFSDAKSIHDEKLSTIEARLKQISEKESELLALEIKVQGMDERALIEARELKKLSSEIMAQKSDLEALEKIFENLKAEQMVIINSKEVAAVAKFAEADNCKAKAEALIKEYEEKLAKLKAVML
jgi:chromosome segregation ATPase